MSNQPVARNVSLFDVDDVQTFSPVREMTVSKASRFDVNEFCRRWHYTNTGGAMTWNYGLWDGVVLVGVVSYNLTTMEACASYFGQERWEWVAHMGRLVCAEDAPRNVESKLISHSMRLLKQDRPVFRAVATYAATSANHLGYVYQATNALYCGMTAPGIYYLDQQNRRRADKQGLHVRQDKARARGWTVHKEGGKHRYVYLIGNKRERKEARRLLKYEVLPYPKAVTE